MLCPLSRMQMSSALDHGGALPWPARRHAETCDGCRAFQARLGALHGRLAAGASSAPSPARPSRSRARLPLYAGLAAATAAVILFVALRRGPDAPATSPPPARVRVATVTPPPGEPPPGAAAETPAQVLPAQVLVDQASGLLAAPPLRHELSALVDDGRRGALAVLDQAGLRTGK